MFLNTTEVVLKFDDMERNDTLFTASCEVLVVMETGRVKSVTFDEPDIVDNAIECREDTNGGETVSLDNEEVGTPADPIFCSDTVDEGKILLLKTDVVKFTDDLLF